MDKLNKHDNDMKISLEVEYVWGLTDEDRKALCNSASDEIIIQAKETSKETSRENFYERIYNTVKKARLAKGNKTEPFFWVTK